VNHGHGVVEGDLLKGMSNGGRDQAGVGGLALNDDPEGEDSIMFLLPGQ